MRPKQLYLALCVAGAVIPSIAFLPWLAEHGLDFDLMLRDLFANRVSAFFALDVIVSAVIVVCFAIVERNALKLQLWWAPVVGVLLAGVSFGLPLLLYLRQVQQEKSDGSEKMS